MVLPRFSSRARALLALRLPFYLGAGILLAHPGARTALGLDAPALGVALGIACASALLLAAALPRLDPAWQRRATFISLCVDTALFFLWAAQTGALRSPILPIQLLLTGVLLLLFPRPAAALPAVGALAALSWLDRVDHQAHLYDLTLLATHGALTVALVYLLTTFDRRERTHQAERERLAKELAGVQERQRLSREMHDGVGGSVAALVLQAQVLESLDLPKAAREQGRLLAETSTEALEELRRSLRLLRDEFDLPAAARDHCERLQKRTGLSVELQVEGAPMGLPPETQLSLFRVLQEALTNVVRHAQASHVWVSLTLGGDGSLLEVRDDGVGLPLEGRRQGYGLLGFQERAELLGASLAIDSEAGRGTSIRFALPRREEKGA